MDLAPMACEEGASYTAGFIDYSKKLTVSAERRRIMYHMANFSMKLKNHSNKKQYNHIVHCCERA